MSYGLTGAVRVPVLGVDVHEGLTLLSDLSPHPSLRRHRTRHGELPRPGIDDLLVGLAKLRGRGGAGFPFAEKLARVTAGRRPPVVVNVAEGEPRSAKDAALAVLAPHLLLDGAAVTAQALGGRDVHVVVPRDRPVVARALEKAIAERRAEGSRLRFHLHAAEPSFIAGQSSAVVELIEGRENKPVTTWRPTTTSGLRGRPTLLSNAETFAHVGATALGIARPAGTADEPGTMLLTIDSGDRRPAVREVELGTSWERLLGADVAAPILLGGYHGTWAAPGALAGLTVSRRELAERGLALGAGVVLVEPGCPVVTTDRVVAYLASQSAGRCGPCVHGLPTLAGLVARLAHGSGDPTEALRIAALVDGRGACAHPDGTARLVRSLLTAYGDEVRRHARGECSYPAGPLR